MSYAPQRSLAADRDAGLTDGAYKKIVSGRGGLAESTTTASRRPLFGSRTYGFAEAAHKVRPDGLPAVPAPGDCPVPFVISCYGG